MRVVIIGGSGHIGSYLTPKLVQAGHSVTCVSRGLRQPYVASKAWEEVRTAALDRDAEEAAGTFGGKIAEMSPDWVIDLTAYTLGSARQLVEALRGRVQHFLHCGTIWVHGPTVEAPVTEE